MKKSVVLFMIAVLVCSSLCACGDQASGSQAGTSGGQASGSQAVGGQAETFGGNDNASSGSGDLQLLSNRYGESACNTENGYYYVTTETEKL